MTSFVFKIVSEYLTLLLFVEFILVITKKIKCFGDRVIVQKYFFPEGNTSTASALTDLLLSWPCAHNADARGVTLLGCLNKYLQLCLPKFKELLYSSWMRNTFKYC